MDALSHVILHGRRDPISNNWAQKEGSSTKIWVIQGNKMQLKFAQDPTKISFLRGLRSPIEYWGVGMIFG